MIFNLNRIIKATYMLLLALLPIMVLFALLWAAKTYFGIETSNIARTLERMGESDYALALIFAAFVIGSFLTLPQWALFVGAMAIFGPIDGGIISWGATLVSSSSNFFVGRILGYSRLGRFSNKNSRVDAFLLRLRENGVLASFAVRFVPTGPFVFVNMLAGASGLAYLSFMFGTALGIVPKILLVALAAQGVIRDDMNWVFVMLYAGAALLVISVIWLVRQRLSKNS